MSEEKTTQPEQSTQAEESVIQTENAEQVTEQVEQDAADVSLESLQAQVVELNTALQMERAAAAEQKDSVLRAIADAENQKRRSVQEIEKARKFALEKLVGDLLPVLDNMERAVELADRDNETLKPMIEGVELTLKSFTDAVSRHGVVEINPQGEAFDPEKHQAMSMQENADFAPNTIMAVMQKGYELNGRLIRPAMVMVSKGSAQSIDTTA